MNELSFKLILRHLSCSVLLMLALSVDAFAWGEQGHRLVARIAGRFLNPQTQSIIADLLKADMVSSPAYYQTNCQSVLALGNKANLTTAEMATFVETGLACIAPWADPPLKFDRPYTANWHFIDIPVNLSSATGPLTTTLDLSRDCPMDDERGDCAVLAVRRFRPILGNPKESTIARVEALKFIVHIIGDLHQPLHCITDKKDFNNLKELGDLGGNFKIVQFNVPTWDNNSHKDVNPRWKEQWNLHSVWDEAIIDATMKIENLDEEKYLSRLVKPLQEAVPAERAELQSGDLLSWIHESYSIAIEKTYKLPAIDPNYEYVDKKANKHTGGYRLEPSYYASNAGVVNTQLQTGGLRLARFLNETLVKQIQ
jgi:hypothetical protein